MKLKGLIIVLMLLGAMGLEAKPKYRIETWVERGTRYYLPQRRVWFRTNYFYLPFKVWQSGQYPLKHKEDAEWIIGNWKDEYESKRLYKHSEYIIVE